MLDAQILIVDDESEIRSVVSEYLEAKGFRVQVAASGAEALSLMETAAEPYALALVDWHLPGISGRDLSLAIQARAPQTVVIITTGDPPKSIRIHKSTDTWVDLVLKPFSLRHLCDRIQNALDSDRGIQQAQDN